LPDASPREGKTLKRLLSLLVAMLLVPALAAAADKKDDMKHPDEKRPEGDPVALVAPRVVYGAQQVRLSVRFSAPVNSAQAFELSSSDPAALSVPATVSLTAVDTETGVMAQTRAVNVDKTVTIRMHPRSGGQDLTAVVTVRPIAMRKAEPQPARELKR
jgi:hypothetical protein